MSKPLPATGANPRISRQAHKPARSAPASLVVAVVMIVGSIQPAHAQDLSALAGMQFSVTPYFWLSGINAAIKTPLRRAPEVNAEVSAIDVLGHLDGIPFMGAFEIRQGPLGFLGDVLHVPVGTNITTRDVFFQGGNAVLNTNMGTGMVLYRLSTSQPSSPISDQASAPGESRQI